MVISDDKELAKRVCATLFLYFVGSKVAQGLAVDVRYSP
jgi:hypothetical protein